MTMMNLLWEMMSFQLSKLVDPYRVAPFNDLEDNSNFCIIENMFIDVDAEELNDVLSSSRHIQVDEYDSDEINFIQDCGEDKDESIDEEENNSD